MTLIKRIRPYLKFFETRFQSLIQYRAAAWAGFVYQFFWGLILIMAMQAFYRSSPGIIAPMTLGATNNWNRQNICHSSIGR